MSTPTTERRLPLQVERRITRLEETVVELSGTIDVVVRELQRVRPQFKLPKGPLGYAIVKKPRARQAGEVSDLLGHAKAVIPPALAHQVEGRGLAGALARGEAARVEWVRAGEVVPAKELAASWGLTPQALGPAAKRGELFAVTVKNQRYYPCEFLTLHRQDVGAVCEQLQGMDPSEQLVFWKRRHGALGGKTIHEVLGSGKRGEAQISEVLQLARALTSQARADAAQAA